LSAYIREGAITLKQGAVETKLLPVSDVPLRGSHNVSNVVAAVAVGAAAGLGVEAMVRAIREFRPVPHRLEVVGTIGGVQYVNDSIATTPERTLAALRSFSEPIVLMLGGRGKNLPLEELASEARSRCHAIVCFGEAAGELAAALTAAGGTAQKVESVASVADAVEAARRLAHEGDVVLLSPACTSYDAYENFEERGEDFRRNVRRWASGA
jgi:UDP-N-acetylmuramoylalanine--D-glutamate ligase